MRSLRFSFALPALALPALALPALALPALALLLPALLIPALPAAAQEQGLASVPDAELSESELPAFELVVHPANPTRHLDTTAVAAMFLGETTKWGNGIDVQAVDQHSQERTQIREAFSRSVHRTSTETVIQRWQRYIFSGERAPPPEMRSDAEVLEFVRSHPGAIGYVSDRADIDGVRVVSLVPAEGAETGN